MSFLVFFCSSSQRRLEKPVSQGKRHQEVIQVLGGAPHSPEEDLANYQHGKSLDPSLERSTCSRKSHTQCGSQEATSCSSGQGNQRGQVDKHEDIGVLIHW